MSRQNVILNGAVRHVLDAKIAGGSYFIDISAPTGPPPAAGWPAIFLLDAQGCFATAVEALSRMSRRSDATGVEPMVVVGVSSDGGDGHRSRRQRDFTSVKASTGATDSSDGGADAFVDFLENEVVPLVSLLHSIDPARLTLFGHSLAGYFVLWAMLGGAVKFSRFAAISPSVWWDKEHLFAAAGNGAGTGKRLFVAIGAWEHDLPPWQAAHADAQNVLARRAARSMVSNARDICASIQTCGGEAVFRLLGEEDHASIISAAIPRSLRLASLGFRSEPNAAE